MGFIPVEEKQNFNIMVLKKIYPVKLLDKNQMIGNDRNKIDKKYIENEYEMYLVHIFIMYFGLKIILLNHMQIKTKFNHHSAYSSAEVKRNKCSW